MVKIDTNSLLSTNKEFDSMIDLHEIFSDIPHSVKMKFSKKEIPELPSCFKPTILGEPKWGMIAQYRCACMNLHAYDFGDHWEIHKDKQNPLTHPIEHLVEDAPRVLGAIVGIGAIVAGATVYQLFKSRRKE
jgi:hypothetical protein